MSSKVTLLEGARSQHFATAFDVRNLRCNAAKSTDVGACFLDCKNRLNMVTPWLPNHRPCTDPHGLHTAKHNIRHEIATTRGRDAAATPRA
jgi:hypothetical protein